VYISGQIDESMRMSGRTINWKVWESSPGLMVANTKINISTIRKKALASSSGPTAESTLVIGKIERNKLFIFTHPPLAKKREENGMRERVQLGLTDLAVISFLFITI